MRPGRSTVTTHTVVDELSSTENESSSATYDRGGVNEEGATDEISWIAMNAWYTGYPVTFKVLQCHAKPKRRSRVLHRGTIVPRALDAVGYNSALQPKNDAYFPVVKPDGGIAGKALPSALQGTVHPPDNTIAEGGGKRRKL